MDGYIPDVEIRVLGPVELVGSSGDVVALQGNKMRGLLAVLALEAGRTVSAQRLIEALWGDQEISGTNVVQVLVSKLRRTITDSGETNCISTRPTGYQLDVESSAVDVNRFASLVDRARAAEADAAGSAALLEEALALWHGVPIGGVPETDLVAAMRSRLVELRSAAVDDLTDAHLVLGRHHLLAAELEALVADDPLRERRWGQLIRALYASGRQADAMRAFQRARDVLIDQIGAEPGPELRRLEAAVLAHDDTVLVATAPAGAVATPVGHGFRRRGNLRHPVSACVGRESAVAEVLDLLDAHRLVTLTGPGGVGKTRLAQELGTLLSDTVGDGVWWVDVAPARGAADVVGSIHRALGIDGGPVTDPRAGIDAIVAILSDTDALFVIDNCEHLVDPIRDIVEELLGRCRAVRVVTTSRERLDVTAERAYDVVPLSADAAVALFTSRRADTADVAGESLDVVREICERLDRLPLALELAAARTRYSNLDELRDRLANRFDLLHDSKRSPHARQRDLRAVADWSYGLLDEAERIVFDRLSVFADGATAAAATSVCAHGEVPAGDVEWLLHRLVDKSLVVADRSSSETRFRMLQTLADYGAERLAERGLVDDARRAHATWVRDLARTVAFGQATDGPIVAAVQAEDAAIRDAVEWSLVAEPALALEICDSLAGFWFGTMRVSAGWELLASALDAGGGNDALTASAQAWAAVFATMLQDLDTAARHAEEALAFERDLDDPMRLGRATLMMALAAGYRDDHDWTSWIQESRQHFDRAGHAAGEGHATFAAGAIELLAGDLQAAAANLTDAIAEFRRHHDHLGLILAVSRLGELAWRAGDIDLYADMHAELLELGRSGRSLGVTTGATARLAHARLVQGDVAEAERLAREALASSGSSFMPVINGYTFRAAGLVNLRLGHVSEGRANLASAIESFSHGAGSLGIGQAAMCLIDLSTSFVGEGESAEARRTAELAVDAAHRSGEPWVREQAADHLASLAGRAGSLRAP